MWNCNTHNRLQRRPLVSYTDVTINVKQWIFEHKSWKHSLPLPLFVTSEWVCVVTCPMARHLLLLSLSQATPPQYVWPTATKFCVIQLTRMSCIHPFVRVRWSTVGFVAKFHPWEIICWLRAGWKKHFPQNCQKGSKYNCMIYVEK